MISFLNPTLTYAKIPSSSPPKGCKYSGQSVRAVPIRIITVGKKRSQGVQLLVDEYVEKLKYYCRVDDIQVRSNPKNTSDVKAQIEGEDMAVMQQIRSDDWVVMLDEHGLDVSSVQMADLVGDAGITVGKGAWFSPCKGDWESPCLSDSLFMDLQHYHFALVGHMVMGDNCGSVLI